MKGRTVILSRRSREAAQDGRRTPSLLTRAGSGKSRGKHAGGPSARFALAGAPPLQDDSSCR